VELTDEAAPFGAKVAPQDHAWQIRLGFCQTTISRAPNGGWTLTIPSDLLCLCPSCEHVVDLFEAMLGAQEERQHKLELWHQSVTAWRERQQPIILAINAFIRPDALEYATEVSDAIGAGFKVLDTAGVVKITWSEAQSRRIFEAMFMMMAWVFTAPISAPKGSAGWTDGPRHEHKMDVVIERFIRVKRIFDEFSAESDAAQTLEDLQLG
jgi:hypothetical protein